MTMQEDAEALHLDDDLDDDELAADDHDADAPGSTEPDAKQAADDDDADDDYSDLDLDAIDEDLSDIDDIDDLDDLDDGLDDDDVDDLNVVPETPAERLRDNVLEIEDRRIQLHEIREARKRVQVLTPLCGGFGAGLLIGRMASGSNGLLLTGAILFLLLAASMAFFGWWLERTMRHDASAILEQLDDTNRELDEVLSRVPHTD